MLKLISGTLVGGVKYSDQYIDYDDKEDWFSPCGTYLTKNHAFWYKSYSFVDLINSLTAIDGHDRQYFNELRSTVVSRQIFIRSQSLIAR